MQKKHATELLVTSFGYLVLTQDFEGMTQEVYLTKEQCALIAEEMETLAAMEKWEAGEEVSVGKF